MVVASELETGGGTRDDRSRSFWARHRGWFNIELTIGVVLFVAILFVVLFAPIVAPYSPVKTFPGLALTEPNSNHLFGTDSIGRDVFSRIVYGGRVSLAVAFPAVAIATLLGMIIGLPAGYFGGLFDTIVMRALDVIFAFPAILLAISVVSIFGASLEVLAITIGLLYMPRMARIVRAPTMSVIQREYVEAARSIGVTDLGILLKHVLPNIASPIIVEISLALGQVILTETALSFLGLGVPPPRPTWGAMLSESRAFMRLAPWTVLAPGVTIFLTVASFILIGTGLRRKLLPQNVG